MIVGHWKLFIWNLRADFANEYIETSLSNPLKRRLAALQVCFSNDLQRLKHVGDVIQAPDFGLQFALVKVIVGHLVRSLLQGNHAAPDKEQRNEALAHDAKRFDSPLLPGKGVRSMQVLF